MVERNMSNAVMRGIVVPPGSRATSRAQGSCLHHSQLSFLENVADGLCRHPSNQKIGPITNEP
jgi:hypothetical protein